MSADNGARRPRTPTEAAIQRRESEEASREHHSRWASIKFGGAAIMGGLAAGGAVVISSGIAELPAASAAVIEGFSTASAVGLFGSGLVDLRLADDASRNAARMVQALAQQELEAGKFISPLGPASNGRGPGAEAPVPVQAGESVTDMWAAQER